MSGSHRWRFLPGLIVIQACSAPNPNVQVRRLADGRLQVKGPLAGPFSTLEELAAKSCELMTSQPGASNGKHGFEYCALHYYSKGSFFLSYLSDIGGERQGGRKFCTIPRSLDDPTHEDVLLLGGAHNHPHNRSFSNTDMSTESHWNPTRLMDKSTGRVFHRELLMFIREKTGECRAYSYNNATRVVAALRVGKWVPIAKAYNDAGDIQMFDGQGWLP